MVIKPSADLDLGAVTVDETSGFARTETTPSALDATVKAVAVDGVPFGAGNGVDGKDTMTATEPNRDNMDMDRDGIPNLFDADEDNDGYRNGIISVPTDTVGTSTVVERAFLSSNIWVPHGEVTPGMTHAEFAPTQTALRVMLTPKSGMEDQITSVQCISVPGDIADIATMNIGSIGDAIDYPPEHSLWKDNDYHLYKMVTETPGSWIASIAPSTVMSIGDTFTVRATYTDGTYEDFFLTTSYIVTDWAWVTSYSGTPLSDSVGSRTTPATLGANTVSITFKKPLDEDGLPLEGPEYSMRFGVGTQDPS